LIDLIDVRKSYGDNLAVAGVSLEIQKGEMFGLLGPNGAGKSTTIAMMAGLIRPDSGSINIAGQDPSTSSAKSRIGLAPQALAIYERLTCEENLVFFAKIKELSGEKLKERVDWALDLSGLADRRKDIVNTFSGGMKRRLNLACALVHGPEVVFLDEPTVGVDPQSRNFIFDSVERLRNEGLTVLYTTHYMEEAERLCDRVAIMDHGKILGLGTVPELINTFGGESMIIAEFDRPPSDFHFPGAIIDDVNLKLPSKEPFKDVAKLAETGAGLKSLLVERPNLETVFLSLTGRSLRD
jgi:ABC-2 type transport system ATP-binding protein